MLEEIKKSLARELCGTGKRALGQGLVAMVPFLFAIQAAQGQCTITSSSVSLSGSGIYCPDSTFTVSVGAFPNQTYSFFHNGQPIPGFTRLSDSTSGLPSISYTVVSMTPADAGNYSVTAYDTCSDGDSLALNTVIAYYQGLTSLSIGQVNGSSATFFWSAGPPGSTYIWALDTTNTFPSSGDSIFSGNATDSFASASGLKGSTKYYVFVTIKNSNCAPVPVWVTNNFTTLLACTANFDSLPTISSNNPSLTMCPNGKIVLQSNSNTGNQWFRDGVIISDSVGSTFTATDSGSYTITVTDSLGCHATSPPVIVTITSAPPTPTISASGSLTFCTGEGVILSSSLGNSYIWFKNDTAIGQTGQNLTVANSGSYTVEVINSGGCSATSAPSVVTVNALPPTPTITPSGPLTFCAGDSVVLSSSSSASYSWFKNDSAVGQTGQNLIVSSSGSYTVQVTNANGCSSISAPIVVSVNALPATPIITPTGSLTFCTGGSVLLNSSPASSYIWYDNAVAVGQTGPSLTVSASGSYTVQVTNGSGCSATSAPSVVTVNSIPPTPTITPSGPSTFCAGDSIVLSSSSGNSYLWFRNDSAVGQTGQNLTATISGSYTVQTSNASGCSAVSAPIIVTVNPVPATPVITPSGGLTFCTGGSVLLNSSSASSYIWYDNDLPIGQTGQSLTVTSSGSYSVKVTNAGGCSATSAPTVVNVNSVPQVPTITPSGPLTFCNGGSVTLSSTTGISYIWYLNDTATGQTTQSLVVNNSGSYSVQVTSSGGCSATSVPTIVTVNTVPATPVITPSGGLTFCTGGSVLLNSSPASSYIWYNNELPIGQTGPSLTVTGSGSYTVQITNAGGCSATSSPTIVNVNSVPPVPTITPSGPLTFCNGGSVTLSSSTGISYTWYLNDTAIGQTTQNLTVSSSGSYTVEVTSSGGCSATSIPTIVNANLSPSIPTITAQGPLTFCGGGSVVLNSSAGSSYSWYQNDSAIGQTNQNITVTSSGSYTVLVTTPGGCSATSDPTVVTVNLIAQVPTITALGSLSFCAGGNVVLSASAANSYSWYRNDTAIGQFVENLTVASSGNYSVQVTNSGGCFATSDPVVVTVNLIPPVPTISGRTILNSCSGDADTLYSSALSGNQWLSNNFPISGETNNSLIINSAGNYSVQVTTAGQCTSVSASTSVTAIGSSPQPTINPIGTVTICAGDSTLLTSSLASGNQWYKDGVALVGDTLQVLYVSASGNYSVFGGNGLCASQSLSTIVNSSGFQGTPKIIVNGDLTICEGGSVLLQSSDSTGNQWYFNGQALFGENGSTYTASAPGNYIVAVGTGACQAFSTAAIVDVIADPPVPIITYNGTNLCTGSVILQSSSDSGNVWYLDTVPIPGATGITYTAVTAGNYTVLVRFGSNCTSVSEPVSVSGSSGVIPIIKITNGVLSSDSTSGNQWYLNDSIIPGATQNTYTAKVPGTYTLQFNHNGCLSSFSAPLNLSAGELTTPNVAIYPVPATDHLTIVNKGANPITVQLYDMAGRRIETVESITGTYQLGVTQLARGPYYIFIIDEITKNKTRQLIIKL